MCRKSYHASAGVIINMQDLFPMTYMYRYKVNSVFQPVTFRGAARNSFFAPPTCHASVKEPLKMWGLVSEEAAVSDRAS